MAITEILIGTESEYTKTITEGDVEKFAEASGDTNPLHLDSSYSQETMFGERISHGILVGGIISAALAELPGTVVYLSQTFNFENPVYLGDTVTATCEITEQLGNDQYNLETRVENGDEVAITGNATVLIK